MTVNATTLARTKALLGDTSSTNDSLYTSLIDSVSREFERFLGYELEQKSRLEIYSPNLNDRIVFLRNWPAVSVSLVRVGWETVWDFAAYAALTANTHYRLVGNELYFTQGALIYGKGTLEVTYVAGIGTNDAGVIAAAPDLSLAADMQVAEEFRRRNNPSTIARPGPGGQKTYAAPHGFLPRVRELLSPRKRMVMVAAAGGAKR